MEAFFKTSSDGYLEIHLDTDDANGFLLKQNDTVDTIISTTNRSAEQILRANAGTWLKAGNKILL